MHLIYIFIYTYIFVYLYFTCCACVFSKIGRLLPFFSLWQSQWIIDMNLESWDHCLSALRAPSLIFFFTLEWSTYHFLWISGRSAYLDWYLLDKNISLPLKQNTFFIFSLLRVFPLLRWEIILYKRFFPLPFYFSWNKA